MTAEIIAFPLIAPGRLPGRPEQAVEEAAALLQVAALGLHEAVLADAVRSGDGHLRSITQDAVLIADLARARVEDGNPA